jgi:hypothetical protein
VRGGSDVLPMLAEAFAQVIMIDATAFMKTMMRKRAVRIGNADVAWEDV